MVPKETVDIYFLLIGEGHRSAQIRCSSEAQYIVDYNAHSLNSKKLSNKYRQNFHICAQIRNEMIFVLLCPRKTKSVLYEHILKSDFIQ